MTWRMFFAYCLTNVIDGMWFCRKPYPSIKTWCSSIPLNWNAALWLVESEAPNLFQDTSFIIQRIHMPPRGHNGYYIHLYLHLWGLTAMQRITNMYWASGHTHAHAYTHSPPIFGRKQLFSDEKQPEAAGIWKWFSEKQPRRIEFQFPCSSLT